MTLLHTVLAARTAALGAPGSSPWPAGTIITPDDVLISGTSLTGLAVTLGTPALLAGAVVDGPLGRGAAVAGSAVIAAGGTGPGSGDRARGAAERRRHGAVVVVRVDAVIPPLHHPREVWVDAEIEGCAPVFTALRLLGRRGSVRTARYRMRPDRSGALAPLVRLPADLRRHDLLAIPCSTCFGLEDIER